METIAEPITEITEKIEKKPRVRKTTPEQQRAYYLKWRESHLQQSLANSKHCYELVKERKRKEKEVLQRAKETVVELSF
jgi:hypothetical protein